MGLFSSPSGGIPYSSTVWDVKRRPTIDNGDIYIYYVGQDYRSFCAYYDGAVRAKWVSLVNGGYAVAVLCSNMKCYVHYENGNSVEVNWVLFESFTSPHR